MACELSARIVPGDARCLQYRRSANDSCRGCVEFTAAVVESVDAGIKPAEVIVDMAARAKTVTGVKKGDKFLCPECNKMRVYESNGKCGSCNHKERLKRKALADGFPSMIGSGVDPVVKPSALYPDLDADVAEVSGSSGNVNAVAGKASLVVDPLVHMALRDAWYEVERKALASLSGLAPASVLVRAANLVQRIQALEA